MNAMTVQDFKDVDIIAGTWTSLWDKIYSAATVSWTWLFDLLSNLVPVFTGVLAIVILIPLIKQLVSSSLSRVTSLFKKD